MAKEAAPAADDANKTIGVCEKLFQALSFNPSFRPARRLTYREHSPATDAAAAAHPPNSTHNPSADDRKTNTSTKPPPAMTHPAAPPKPVPVPAPPRAVAPKQLLPPPTPTVPVPAPPKAVAQPAVAAEESEEKKKSINERAAEYIKRARMKIRSNTLGRTLTTKKTS